MTRARGVGVCWPLSVAVAGDVLFVGAQMHWIHTYGMRVVDSSGRLHLTRRSVLNGTGTPLVLSGPFTLAPVGLVLSAGAGVNVNVPTVPTVVVRDLPSSEGSRVSVLRDPDRSSGTGTARAAAAEAKSVPGAGARARAPPRGPGGPPSPCPRTPPHKPCSRQSIAWPCAAHTSGSSHMAGCCWWTCRPVERLSRLSRCRRMCLAWRRWAMGGWSSRIQSLRSCAS
jgi:hypothetical protein